MDTTIDRPRAPGPTGLRPALVVAATGSAMAALVHAVAVGSHEGDRLLVWLFALTAAAQLGWAASALAGRASRTVLAAGLLINGGALVVWGLTRTVGILWVAPMAEAEAVGSQDLAAALFAAGSVAGTLCLLLRPRVTQVLAPGWAGMLVAVAMVAALPALTAGHTHVHGHADHGLETTAHGHDDDGHGDHGDLADGDGHGHDDGHSDASDHGDDPPGTGHDDHDDDGHGHDSVLDADLVNHGHGENPAHDAHPPTAGAPHVHPPTGGAPHAHPPTTGPTTPTGPIISLDDPRLTPAQRAVAVQLIAEVKSALAVYPNVDALIAAGYTSIGDGGTQGYEHFVNWSYLTDGHELNPALIESVVVKKNGDGTKTIVSGMYILSVGKTMADVPELAGELTTWHDHTNLCFEGTKLVGVANGGVCARGTLLVTPPMLHVWLAAHPCGPFAGIESHGEGACGGHDH